MEEEISFPRGGAERIPKSTEATTQRESSSSSKKKKARKRSESNDFLFGAGSNGYDSNQAKKKSKRSKKHEGAHKPTISSTLSSLPLGGGAVQPPIDTKKYKKPAIIESISFTKLTKGTKLLGIVSEVAQDYAVVSLPSMLNGFIRRTNNSGIRLDHVVKVGMVLPVVVVKTTSETVKNKSDGPKTSNQPVVKKRIELTVSPSAVNNGLTNDMLYEGISVRGRIRSIEDHGCLVDLSISGIGSSNCFLKYENIEGGYEILNESNNNDEDDDEEMDYNEQDDKFILNKGRIYDFTVFSLPKKQNDGNGVLSIIQLKLETAKSRSKILVDPLAYRKSKQTIRSLSPGMLLKVDVEHFARNGLCVTFMGSVYRASIHSNHLGGYLPEDYENHNDKKSSSGLNDMWWKNVFVGKLRKIDARLIAVDPVSKIIRFSLLPHILSLTVPKENDIKVGQIVENARVIRLDSGVGALLALPIIEDQDDDNFTYKNENKLQENAFYRSASKIRCAYVHISKAMDNEKNRTPEALFAKTFALNTIIRKLRIISCNNWIDNIISCATAESIVSSAVLTHMDLKPGAIYRSVPVIANLDNGSVLVKLGEGVKGLIPSLHLFDKSIPTDSGDSSYRSKVRMEKYKVGNKIDVRCLVISPSEKKCVLTAKKGLVTSDIDNPITEYSSIQTNRTATGYITRVSKEGIAITFYNNVFGRINARKLAEEMGVEDPTVDYSVGDVIKVKIISCFKKRGMGIHEDDGEEFQYSYNLNLSLNLLSEEGSTTKDGDSAELVSLLKPGTVLKSKSMRIVELVLSRKRENNCYIPGHAVILIKSKHLRKEDEKTKNKGSINCKLPFEHIFDSHDPETTQSPESMDALATKVLTVGKKIAQEAVVLSVFDRNGLISTPIVSLKPILVATAKKNLDVDESRVSGELLPQPSTALFIGAYVRGYCVRLHQNHGAFIRFLGGLTGIIPKLKGGLNIGLYDTVLCKVVVIDLMSGKIPKILLRPVDSSHIQTSKKKKKEIANVADSLKPGDVIREIKIDDINFVRAKVILLDKKFSNARVEARVHMTMAKPIRGTFVKMPIDNKVEDDSDDNAESENQEKITKYHPFYTWKVGDTIRDVKCVAVDVQNGKAYIELTNRDDEKDCSPSLFVDDPGQLNAGSVVSGVITSIAKQNKGLWVQISPGVTGFIPGLELCGNMEILKNLKSYFKVGGKVTCCVVEGKSIKGLFKMGVRLSVLAMRQNLTKENRPRKPVSGEQLIGRVNRFITEQHAPALMIELPGGFLGRCDITELEEIDDWENMPLGRSSMEHSANEEGNNNSPDEDKADDFENDEDKEVSDHLLVGEYHHGLYVQCRVLASSGISKGIVEVSLRQSRLDGDLDNDEPPEEKELVHAYVVSTTKKGCFLRLSRLVEGRTILKELSDSFLPDPTAMFPPGRLVVGKVKKVQRVSNKKSKTNVIVDLDMRESVLLDDQNKLTFEDVKVGDKYSAIVTRIESYGVFVRPENSNVSGLVHLSECSDDYVKNLGSKFNPGDLVKVLVVKVEKESRRIGFSMKASHFKDDDSDDYSDLDSVSDSDDDIAMKVNDGEVDLDSDDENFVSKLADKIGDKKDTSDDDSDSSTDDSDDESSKSSLDDSDNENLHAMDTDVGFDWGMNVSTKSKNEDVDSSDDSNSGSDSDDDNVLNKGRKSRKKTIAKRQEEKAISKMEQRIADGSADENPETTADFERLIASDPNSSENWIKFMAYHLSLADIESARSIANRAFDRIEFREENEKMNVWTALIMLESKYGTFNSLNTTIDRASQHNNPKQIYLRVCEMMEREVEQSHGDVSAIEKADEMFTKMCKKFKSKKTVWIAHFKYLLKSGRHEEAHKLWKRSVMSLPVHKHIESMSKFAQLEYEYGSAERARTIFDALMNKHPKRMDLIFVYVDKEVKYGDLSAARRIFDKIVTPTNNGQKKAKFNDKQMKSLFKKWYRMEDEHGDEESRMYVKVTAKEYVERSTK